jgi:electron transport complex protein RnfD
MTVHQAGIVLRTSPHLKERLRTDTIMLNVVYALLPIVGFAIWAFGLSALLLIGVTTAACVLTEHLTCRAKSGDTTVTDYSAVITGLLLALTLPPGLPLWMGALGGVLAIALGKAMFGGLGYNPFNPALVGRAFLQAAFPVAMTTWSPAHTDGRMTAALTSTLAYPFAKSAPLVDGMSSATPMSLMKFEQEPTEYMSLFIGSTSGSLGETSSLLIVVCGTYLIARGMMNWRIPAALLASVFVTSGALYLMDPEVNPTPIFMLLSGGVMLGAVFMATDMVASPTTPRGVWIYGIFIGALTVLIRLKGGLPEGVMYAILLGNAVSPFIEQLTQPRVYGTGRGKSVS